MDIDLKSIDEETKRNLFFEGATLIILGVPKGTEFGIDMKVWNTDEKFRGFKMIPPGLHFIHYSAVGSTGNLAPRSGFFHNFKRAEFLVKMYDCKMEDISEKEVNPDEVQKLKENLIHLDAFLGPYPYDVQEKWLLLTSHITEEVTKELVPKSGYIRSALILMSCTDEDRPRGNSKEPEASCSTTTSPVIENKRKRKRRDSFEDLLPDLKPVEGTDIQFTKFPDLNYPPDSSPAEITKHSLDSTFVLDTMLTRHANLRNFIGEIQFAFICFLVGHSLEAFEHWKSLVGLLCSCDTAIVKHRLLYDLFISILEPELSEIPEEFLADIVANNNFVYVKLKQFFRTVYDSTVDGRLKSKIWRFRDNITEKYQWEFNELDDEDEDDAPVIVEMNE